MKQIFILLSLLMALNGAAQNFDEMLNTANGYFFEKDYKTALTNYQKIVNTNVGDSIQRSWAYGYIGVCNQELKNLDQAVKGYRKSLLLGSPYANFYKNLLKIYKDKKDYKGQEFVLLTQQKNLPHEYRKATKKLAYVYLNSKQFKKLLPVCDKLISWYPNKSKYIYFKAIAYHQMQQIDKAIAAYRKTLELNADDINSNNNLGMLLFIAANKKFDKAVDSYEAIAKPTDADYQKCKQKLAIARKEMLVAEPYLLKAYEQKATQQLKNTLHTLYIKCNKSAKAKLYK